MFSIGARHRATFYYLAGPRLYNFHWTLPLSFLFPTPLLSLPLFLPSLYIYVSFPSRPFPLPLELGSLNTVSGPGEHCKLPQRGRRRSPGGNRKLCILALKSDIWWQQFY